MYYDITTPMDIEDRMLLMASQGKRLFVWVSEQPCVMVLPPHCFHTVFTLSTACHSGVRAGSDLWKEEMAEVIRWICNPAEQKFIRSEILLLTRWMNRVHPDIEIWLRWCETIKREPVQSELDLMTILEPLSKVIKYNLRYFHEKGG